MTITKEPDTSSSYGTDPGDPAPAQFVGGVGEHLSPDAVTDFVVSALRGADFDGKRVCLVVPDGTRTCPLPLLLTGGARERWTVERGGHGGDRVGL